MSGLPVSPGRSLGGEAQKAHKNSGTLEAVPIEPAKAGTPHQGSTMRELLEVYPGAQRALFRRYHIGGCSSCAFQPEETIEQVCRRNGHLNVEEVLAHIQVSHEQDEKTLISPTELTQWLRQDPSVRLVDVRSREEFDAVHVEGSVLLSQPVMREIMAEGTNTHPLVLIDHQGTQSLDAAAYFMGHGLQNVRCLRGGIDAWARQVDPKLPRYKLD
jgi:rhodanese-related sulfurtransferase